MNDRYFGNPTNRTRQLTIVMGRGNGNDRSADIMESTALMTDWGNKLVASCLDVAVVRFGVWGSDWLEDFAIQENDRVKLRTCIEDELGIGVKLEKLPWNYRWCYYP